MIIPVGNSQVNHFFGGAGIPTGAQVTYGVDNSTGLSAADVAEACHTAFASNVVPQLVTDVNIFQTLAKNGPNDTGPSAIYSSLNVGSNGGTGIPPNGSILISKVTAMGGRQGKGRMFVPGYREDHINTAGVIDGTDVTTLQTAFQGFFDDLEAADLPMILLRSEDSPSQPPETVTSLQVSGRIATQRRRLRR